jgi:16S rRNA (guanine527-N7)-methyltransferase
VTAGDHSEPSSLVRAAAALGAHIDERQAERLLGYLDAMLTLNEQINLTAVREREHAIVLHVLDSLAFASTNLHPQHVLDLGSGNGFPGVALATLHPGASVTLMERTGKKVRAIGSCLVAAKLDRIETLHLDAAQAPALRRDLRHAFDAIAARAVGAPALLGELAEPLLRPGGELVVWLDRDAEVPDRFGPFRLAAVHRYELPPPTPRQRQLGRWRKA